MRREHLEPVELEEAHRIDFVLEKSRNKQNRRYFSAEASLFCPEARCSCTLLGIRIQEENAIWEPMEAVVDVVEHKLISPEPQEPDYELTLQIVENMDELSWLKLRMIQLTEKKKLLEIEHDALVIDPNTVFDEEGHDLYTYQSFFPLEEFQTCTADGVTYILMEQYNPTIEEPVALLSFFVRESKDYIETIAIHLKQDIWKNVDSASDVKPDLMSAYKEAYPEYLKTLREHRRTIVRLYGEYLRDKGITPPREQPEPETTAPRRRKIGRNESCPCGSGKKYKRCCGR